MLLVVKQQYWEQNGTSVGMSRYGIRFTSYVRTQTKSRYEQLHFIYMHKLLSTCTVHELQNPTLQICSLVFPSITFGIAAALFICVCRNI